MSDSKPFDSKYQPGQTGNKGGRPKGLARLVREHIGQAGWKVIIDSLFGMVKDTTEDGRVRVAAAKEILDRGWGKALAQVDVTTGNQPLPGAGTVALNLDGLSLAEFAKVKATLEQGTVVAAASAAIDADDDGEVDPFAEDEPAPGPPAAAPEGGGPG